MTPLSSPLTEICMRSIAPKIVNLSTTKRRAVELSRLLRQVDQARGNDVASDPEFAACWEGRLIRIVTQELAPLTPAVASLRVLPSIASSLRV